MKINKDDLETLIKNTNLIMTPKGKLKRGVLDLFLKPLEKDIREMKEQGCPPYLMHAYLITKGRLPNCIKRDSFSHWIKKNIDKRQLPSTQDKKPSTFSTANVTNERVIVPTATINHSPSHLQSNISKTVDNIVKDKHFINDIDYFKFQVNRINNSNKSEITQSENVWLSLFNNAMNKQSKEYVQYYADHSNQQVLIKEETLTRKFGIIPSDLHVLDPSRTDYPFAIKVNWLLYDEKGIIYTKGTQLPIPIACTLYPHAFANNQYIISRNIRLFGDFDGDYNAKRIIEELTAEYEATHSEPKVIRLLDKTSIV